MLRSRKPSRANSTWMRGRRQICSRGHFHSLLFVKSSMAGERRGEDSDDFTGWGEESLLELSYVILKDILLFLPLQPACCLRAASHSGLITIRVKGNVASSLSAAPFPIFHGSVCRQRRQTAILRRPNEPALPRCALVPHDSPAILSSLREV